MTYENPNPSRFEKYANRCKRVGLLTLLAVAEASGFMDTIRAHARLEDSRAPLSKEDAHDLDILSQPSLDIAACFEDLPAPIVEPSPTAD